MVFLGGAVLANIVSQNQHSRIIHHADNVFCKDGRQARHVDLETGVGGAGRTSAGKVGRKVEIDLVGQNTNVKIQYKQGLASVRALILRLTLTSTIMPALSPVA